MNDTITKIVRLGFFAITLATFQYAGAQPINQPHSTIAFELKEYAVYHVQGKKPYRYRDNDYNLKESKTAYLITFTFPTQPKTMNMQVNFYIGDYRIPEYGEKENGIYFRVYDAKLLESLNGKIISYQVGNMENISLRKEFVTPDIKNMKLVSEETIIKKKQ